jgi:peptidoglycan-associated lipoprotein
VKKSAVLIMLVAGMLAACQTQKAKQPEQQTTTQQPGAQPTGEQGQAQVATDALDDPNSPLAKRSVYYPLDVSVVQPEDRPLVAEHAKYLAAHTSVNVRLEGNCDERGSNEYNLALGQRRADGVKKLLLAGGATAGQIQAVSNGEEKPKATCHAEKCWKENRRTDLIYRR